MPSSFDRCHKCQTIVPADVEYCQQCGTRLHKWCATCEHWKRAWYETIDVDEDAGIVTSTYRREAIHCPDCGNKLVQKGPAHE